MWSPPDSTVPPSPADPTICSLAGSLTYSFPCSLCPSFWCLPLPWRSPALSPWHPYLPPRSQESSTGRKPSWQLAICSTLWDYGGGSGGAGGGEWGKEARIPSPELQVKGGGPAVSSLLDALGLSWERGSSRRGEEGREAKDRRKTTKRGKDLPHVLSPPGKHLGGKATSQHLQPCAQARLCMWHDAPTGAPGSPEAPRPAWCGWLQLPHSRGATRRWSAQCSPWRRKEFLLLPTELKAR